MTLALLLTAVTGAWAQGTLNVVELEVPAVWETDNNPVTAADLTGFKTSTLDKAQAWTGAPAEGKAMLFYAFDGDVAHYVSFENGTPIGRMEYAISKAGIFGEKSNMKFYYTAEAPVTVEWNASTKTGTFAMPGSDVVLTPIYAKAAAFATTGTEPEVKTLLPEAAEGVIAGTDASLIAEGTGIVAFAGTSTEVTQGTVMYAVTDAEATKAPELTEFSADVPTAKDIADDGADVLVWYYIAGADAPQGEAATLDNTFNNSDVASLTVSVRSNKFDLAFKAANANTIDATQASKGTVSVKVGDAEAEDKTEDIAEGKLKAIKMGSEVKLNTKQGYKFRKVEVKKAAAAAPAKPEYADNAEELPANTKLYMRADLVYNGDWIWIPTYTADQAQEVANYYAAITGTKCAVIYGHGAETDIYYVTSDNGVSGTVYRSDNLTDKFPGYKVYLLK